jgi:hypothetical protein
MASTIKLKNSTTAGNSPTSLETGEVAINVADGNLFYGSASAVLQNFVVDELQVKGNLTAQQYIVSSSVTYTTQSFSSGSTIFGNTQDDTHSFTGSVDVTGSVTATSVTSSKFNIGNGTQFSVHLTNPIQQRFEITSDDDTLGRFDVANSGGGKLTITEISASGNITASAFKGDGSGLTGVGTVDTSGTPAVSQVALFVDSDTIKGDSNFTYNTLIDRITIGAATTDINGALDIDYATNNSAVVDITNTWNNPMTSTHYALKVEGGSAFGTPGSGIAFGGHFLAGDTNTNNPDSIALYAQGHEDGAPNSYAAIFSGSAGGVVGINTMEPTVELDVVGDVNVSSNITASGNISSSGALIGNTLTAAGLDYPTADGEDGYVIKTDGAGNLSFDRPTIYAKVKNVSGGTLAKGTPVHANGTSGNSSEVVAASASVASTMPATFVLAEELAADAEGNAIVTGFIQGIDTLGFGEGDVVYVGADGGYTNVKPTGSNKIQNLGIITKVHESNGSGFIYGSGRSNDVPNITSGYAWVGNSDQVATAVATSSFVVDNANTASYVAGGNVDGDVANATDATNATNVNVGNSDASSTYYIVGALGTGNQALKRDNAITFNSATDTLNVGNLDSSGKIFIGTDNVELRGAQGNFIVYDAGLNVNDGHITASAGHFLGVHADTGGGASTYLRTSGDAAGSTLKLEFGDLEGNGSETKLVIDDTNNVIDITGDTDISGDLSINGIANVSASIAAAASSGGGGTTKMYLHSNFFLSTSETTKRYVPFNNAVDQSSINTYLTQVPVMNAGSVTKISIWPQASSTSFTIGIHKNANTTAIESVTQSTTAGTPITFTFSTNTFAALDEMAFSVTSNHTSNNGINMIIEFENS